MLRIENFTLRSFNKEIFSIDTFPVENKSLVNIFGNNDCGKSLLLKSIHGEYTDYEGRILIEERPPIFYKKRKKSILIESNPHLLENETVWKNITIPLLKISSFQKTKIMEFCKIAGLGEIFNDKIDLLPFSSTKFIELIRAAIQLPYLILLDDLDNYFDEINLMKSNLIFDYCLKNGTTIISTSKRRLDNFSISSRIQNGKMVVL